MLRTGGNIKLSNKFLNNVSSLRGFHGNINRGNAHDLSLNFLRKKKLLNPN